MRNDSRNYKERLKDRYHRVNLMIKLDSDYLEDYASLMTEDAVKVMHEQIAALIKEKSDIEEEAAKEGIIL